MRARRREKVRPRARAPSRPALLHTAMPRGKSASGGSTAAGPGPGRQTVLSRFFRSAGSLRSSASSTEPAEKVTEGDSRKRSLGNGGPTKKKARKVPEKEEENISVASHHPESRQKLFGRDLKFCQGVLILKISLCNVQRMRFCPKIPNLRLIRKTVNLDPALKFSRRLPIVNLLTSDPRASIHR